MELVPRCIVKPYWSERYKRMTQEHIDWSTIGARLNRIPSSCCTTWIGLQHSTMKQGSFTAEEDALITRGVAEWGDKRGKGLWVILQKEMGRPAKTILERWKTLNFKFRSSNSSIIRREELKGINHKIWTHEMVSL